jgi:hypothetical protein
VLSYNYKGDTVDLSSSDLSFGVLIWSKRKTVFFAIGQVVGTLAPVFYVALIGNGSNRTGLTIGHFVGGGIMILAGLGEVALGINAERKALEFVVRPLTALSSQSLRCLTPSSSGV